MVRVCKSICRKKKITYKQALKNASSSCPILILNLKPQKKLVNSRQTGKITID